MSCNIPHSYTLYQSPTSEDFGNIVVACGLTAFLISASTLLLILAYKVARDRV